MAKIPGSRFGGAVAETLRNPLALIPGGGKPLPRLDPHPEDPVARGFKPIEFQFQPERLMIQSGNIWGEATAPGGAYPVIQFAGKRSERIRFRTRFWAETGIESIDANVKALEEATEPDDVHGRPPVWVFTWGDFLQVPVVIETIGGQRVESVRGGLPLVGGAGLRSMSFNIVLRKYVPFDIVETDPGARPADTFHHRVRSGDTWEWIARTRYRAPLKGVLLRRRNPDKPLLTVGEIVDVPRPERLRGVVVTPDSIPLKRVAAAIEARAEVFTARGGSKRSTVITEYRPSYQHWIEG